MAVQKIKFLHCADIHIDFPFCDRGGEGYSEIRRQDVRRTFESIISLSQAEKVDFLIISGDLYEHRHASRATIEWISGLFRKMTVPVVIIPGNHDPYAANSWYKVWDWPENVFILSKERPHVVIGELDTFIYGVGFSAFNQNTPDLAGVAAPDPEKFNLLMFHGTLDIALGKPYNPVTSEVLAALGYDYYALGHFHNPASGYKLRNAANPGSPEPLGFDEKGDHGVFIVTMERGGPGGKRLDIGKRSTARREYVELTLDITSLTNSDQIKQKISERLTSFDADRFLIRVVLKGRAQAAIDVGAIESELAAGRKYLRIRNDSSANADYASLATDSTLKGAFVREMLGRIKQCEGEADGGQSAILSMALELGVEALENGRIDESFDGRLKE